MPPPRAFAVSVVIVCWNSGAYLPGCLAALAAQTYRDFEVIAVDNASTDRSVDGLAAAYPSLRIRVEHLAHNMGFAAASNVGAALAGGEWLVSLNPDAFPASDWLEQLTRAAGKFSPKFFFASRQIQASNPTLLDGEGDEYHISGLAWRRNFGLPIDSTNPPREAFSACAAAAMYPRDEFLAVGGFDEDYFAYLEDVDLGFRLRLRDLECIVVSTAVVYHVGMTSTGKGSDFAVYHSHRNLVWTFVKDMPALLFWTCMPLAIATNLWSLFSYSLRGRSTVIWRAKSDALRGLPAALRKRRLIQSGRIASAAAVYRAMQRGLFAPLQARHPPTARA